jgi:SAM-dependent methyltransferase
MEAVTPPPKRKEEAVTTPPRREEQAVALPPKREMEAVTPPPKRKEEAVTPPPEPLKSPRSVAGTGGTAAPARGVSPPAAQASATTGALPEAPIRMVESGEVKDGEFEVMEPGDTPSAPLPTVPTPPPVPAISGVLATTSQPPRTEASAEAGGSVGGAKAEDLAREALPLPEALSRRPLKKRLKPWFEEVFDENYLRTLPFMTAQQTLRETAFVKEALSPPAAGEVLDIACGYGRHAIELSQRGFRVTGLDLSLPLLIRAADEAQRRTLSVNFVHADMREMTYDSQFDAAYCVLTSFGYFDEETNLRVATSICRAIKPGGRFLVDTINRDYIVSDLPSRVWWEGDGCVVLEEVDFDFHTSRVLIRRSIVFGDGRQLENEISIRAYSLHELGRVLRRAGFQVLEVSGSLENKEPFLGAASRHVVLVCERPVT